jgi:DNA-directed RNA polymerase specialized sigma24 family protein
MAMVIASFELHAGRYTSPANLEGGRQVLDDVSQVITALLRYQDVFDPRTSSILTVSTGARGFGSEPFCSGFISGLEERAELRRRLRSLDPRQRAVLYLWYVESYPVMKIARKLGISRVHCYRVRKRALEEMTVEYEERRESG